MCACTHFACERCRKANFPAVSCASLGEIFVYREILPEFSGKQKNCYNKDKLSLTLLQQFLISADDEIWTHTRLLSLEPESSASTVPPHPLTVHKVSGQKNSAEDGTWTHTTAIATRSLVLLVYQFQHFRIYFIFSIFICLTERMKV